MEVETSIFNRIHFSDHDPEKLLDTIILHALHQITSDIHIEPFGIFYRLRYRRDGLLYEIAEINSSVGICLVVRLKVMAQLDIAEKRLPQDGRFQMKINQKIIHLRINTCPTLYGEKIVLRLQDTRQINFQIPALGLTQSQQKLLLTALAAPQGFILVTGPTGSGKTVTLYAALNALNTAEKNISTVEDPIEISVPGVNQVAVNPKIGLHFHTALRTLLRQDPDVLMIGEIRDSETANIATLAAQTGHLVLSTVHTNNALASFTRLQQLGIEKHNLVNALTLIIAQRLVRKLCQYCKQPEFLNKPFATKINIPEGITFFRAKGCQYCLQGYQGRIGIYETLPMNRELMELIMENANYLHILTQLHKNGFVSMYQAGLQAVIEGVTSFEELNRTIIPTIGYVENSMVLTEREE